MLVTSVNGQSVICGATGGTLYRNREDDGLDASALKGTRLDNPADERFDLTGLYGGGLRTVTDDGWSVERLGPSCVLYPATASVHFLASKWVDHNKDATFHLLDRSGEEIRALVFLGRAALLSARRQAPCRFGTALPRLPFSYRTTNENGPP